MYDWRDRSLSLWQNDGSAIRLAASSPGTVEGGSQPRNLVRRVRAHWDGTTVRCTFANDAGESAEITYVPGGMASSTLDGSGGMRVYNETADFLSFVVYH
jgi:hypothetical protein